MTPNLVKQKIYEYQKNPTDPDLNHDMAVIIFYFIYHSKVWTNDSEIETKYFRLCEKLLSNGSPKCKHQLAMIYISMLYDDCEYNHGYDTFYQVLVDEKEKEEKYKMGFSMLNESAKSGYIPSMIYKLIYIPSDENQLRKSVNDFLSYVFGQDQSENDSHISEYYHERVCNHMSKIIGNNEREYIGCKDKLKEIRFVSMVLSQFYDFSIHQQQSITELRDAPEGSKYSKAKTH